jgi:hypothetical protein
MAEEQEKDPKRAAIREIRWLGNTLKGLIAWADEAQDEMDAVKLTESADAAAARRDKANAEAEAAEKRAADAEARTTAANAAFDAARAKLA